MPNLRSSAGIGIDSAHGTPLAAWALPITRSDHSEIGRLIGTRSRRGRVTVTHLAITSCGRSEDRTTPVFRRAKALVGLDIGSSAVKAVELKPAGKGYKVAAFGSEPVPPDSIVDGAIIDGGAVADAIRRLFDGRGIKTKDVAASLSGNAVIVKKITAAGDDRSGAGRVDLLGGRAVHPLRHPGRQSRLPDPRQRQRDGGKGTMDVLLVAAKKEKIADYTGVIAQAGRSAVGRRRRRLRAAERLRGQLRHRARRGRRAAQRRRERHQHQHPQRRPVGLHPRHLDRRQRLHRGAAAGAEPAVRARRPAEARHRRSTA